MSTSFTNPFHSVPCSVDILGMPEESRFPKLEIPSTDLLTWIYSNDEGATKGARTGGSNNPDEPIWLDASEPARSVSRNQLLNWVRRLGYGLEKQGLTPGNGSRDGDVVLLFSTNHIYVPVVYFGAAGYGYIFSGVNPGYGIEGS